jgi:hypothetical protein
LHSEEKNARPGMSFLDHRPDNVSQVFLTIIRKSFGPPAPGPGQSA